MVWGRAAHGTEVDRGIKGPRENPWGGLGRNGIRRVEERFQRVKWNRNG